MDPDTGVEAGIDSSQCDVNERCTSVQPPQAFRAGLYNAGDRFAHALVSSYLRAAQDASIAPFLALSVALRLGLNF